MKLIGHVGLQLLNKDTLEVEYEYDQKNTLGWSPYVFLAQNQPAALCGGQTSNGNAGIQITDSKAELTKYNSNISGTVSDATFNISGSAVPNEFWPQLTNDTANNRYIIQYKQRFQPGASTRTINTITLGFNNAGLNLTTPCTQTTTQILDVFYSLYVPYDTSKYNDTQFNQAYLNSNVIIGSLFSYSGNTPIYSPGTSTALNPYFSFSNLTNIQGGYICTHWQNGLTINGKGSTNRTQLIEGIFTTQPVVTTNVVQGTRNYSISLANTDNIGNLISSLSYYPSITSFDATTDTSNQHLNQPITISPIVKSTDSPIQSIYLKNPSYPTISPYLDPSSIGSSTGTIAMDGSGWTDADVPLMFKFNIKNSGSGALATTSYNFQVRPTFGFTNNAIGSENTQYLYHSAGQINPTGQVSPNLMHWNYPGIANPSIANTTPLYFGAISARDQKSMIYADLTGISILNAYTSNYVNFDSTTTPALNTSAIIDIDVGLDGTIYIATTDQGLYKLSSDHTTITKFTGIGTGVTDTQCYSVAVKDNGDVWAIFNGGLAKLPNGGSTWTIYNSSSTPSFTYVGISDGNWANVSKLLVNRTNTTDQLLLVRKNVNTCVWWGPTTPTPVALNNMIAGFANVPLVVNRMIKHLPNTNSWYFNTNTANLSSYSPSINICSFGNTGADKTFTVGSLAGNTYPYSTIMMKPFLYNGNYVMRIMISNYYQNNANRAWHGYYDITGTLVHDPLPSTFTSTLGAAWPIDFVSDNVALYQYYGGNSPYLRLYNAYDTIGASNAEAWVTYGWDNVNNIWIVNNTGYKPMHTDSQTVYKGLKVSFADAPSSSNFANGEYWFAYVYKGLHKDNSTSAVMGMSQHVRDSYTNSELSSYTVPASGFGSLTNQQLNFYTLNSSLSQLYTYKGNCSIGNSATSYSTLANSIYSEQIFPSDFQINFSATSKPYTTGTGSWAVLGFYDTTLVNPTFTTAGVGYFQFDGTGYYVKEANANKTTPTLGTLATDVFSIKRVGTTISYLYNGTTIYTSTTAVANPIRAFVQMFGEYQRVFTNMNVTYNETRPIVTIGSQANSTGIYDQNFAMVEAWLTNPTSYQINLNGAPCNVWTDPVKIPAAGEVTLLQKSGWLIFNPADAGKTITSNVTILKEF